MSHTIKISNTVNNLQLIGDGIHPNALKDSLSAVWIGDKCTAIGPSCFMNCRNLLSVYMPQTCKDIGDYAFYGCENLKYVTCIDDNDSYMTYNIGAHAFEKCNSLDSVCLTIYGANRDTKIEEYAFANCKGLKKATWRKSGYSSPYMFYGCDSLTSLNFEDTVYVSQVFPHCFAGLTSLEKITLPNTYWMLPDGMFEGDANLKKVTITDTDARPATMMQAGNDVFSGCDSLTSLTMPRSMNKLSVIDDYFLRGSSIQQIKWNGLSDDAFMRIEKSKVTIQSTNFITSKTEYDAVRKQADKQHVPILLFSNKYDLNYKGSWSCGACVNLANLMNSSEFKKFMKESLSVCYFCYSMYYVTGSNFWHPGHYFAETGIYWNKPDGKIINEYKEFYSIYSVSQMRDLIKGADQIVKDVEVQYDGLSKYGSSCSSVTYISNSNRKYTVTNDIISRQNFYTIDQRISSDFMYGTWYGNAVDLKKFVDDNNIPTLIEFGSKGCPPCETFGYEIFNDSDFQKWSQSRPYMFCKILAQMPGDFDDTSHPQEYFVDKNWCRPSPKYAGQSMPNVIWYWKKKGEEKPSIWEISSYHFNPTPQGEVPSWDKDWLMKKTDEFFGNYLSAAEFEKIKLTSLYDATKINLVGYKYKNVSGDDNGRGFSVNSVVKTSSKYEIQISINGYPTLKYVEENQTITKDFPTGTYQYFNYTSDTKNDAARTGCIFKVVADGDNHKIQYVYTFANSAETNAETETPSFSFSEWYNKDSSSSAGFIAQIVSDTGNVSGAKLLILKSSSAQQTDINAIKTGMSGWMRENGKYIHFVHLQSDEWTSGIGKELADFVNSSWHQQTTPPANYGGYQPFDDNQKHPICYLYAGCENCVPPGSNPTELAKQVNVYASDTELSSVSEITDALYNAFFG